MVLEDAIKKKRSMLCNSDVRVYDHKLKNITSSGRELHQILSDMGVYVAVAAPHVTPCVWSAPSGSSVSDQTFPIVTGSDGPSVGIVLSMALSTTDTPRFLDLSITAVNSTRGVGYTCQMDHIKADFFQQKPEFVVLFTRVNGKNANSFACADTVTLVLHSDCGLRDGDLIKVETIDVGHPFFEEYLAADL